MFVPYPVDQAFNGPRVAKGGVEMCLMGLMRACWHLSLGKGCMWLSKVTKLLQSKSGDLYLALQMARCGLCLGPLGFRLHCVLLHVGGLYIIKWLLFK